jgi:hypothetical protein
MVPPYGYSSRKNTFLPPYSHAVLTSMEYTRLHLTNGVVSRIKVGAAVAATRGDLGQLAPRKKLLKSCRVSQKNF